MIDEVSDAHKIFIHQSYNSFAHGIYCPCRSCGKEFGALPSWIHDIGKLERWY